MEISTDVDPVQVVSYIYANTNPVYLRLLWDYSFILLPMVVLLGSLLFRACWCTMAIFCGIGTRYCNVITCMAFVLLLVLMSLLFVALYPFLDNSV